MNTDFFEINKLLYNKIQSGEPFSCLRIDNTCGYVLHCLYQTNAIPSAEFCNDKIMLHIGVVPATSEYYLSTIMPKTFEVMKQCDILGFVDINNSLKTDKQFLSNFPDKQMYFDYNVMDPGFLMGYSKLGTIETPWTESLRGKKVLVVSSHSNSIKYQWERIHSVWGGRENKITPFELVDVIRTPYHPELDDRQYPNCSNFMEMVEITQNIIDGYDYDVLLTGITTQSPFYAEHAKLRGKVGIQIGGSLQLFFGVVGNRWVQPWYSDCARMFNENWIWPMQIDEPQKKHMIDSETGFAYWR
jgi:hypothetical protein